MSQNKLVLNHDMCRIYLDQNEYKLFIKMFDGKWALQKPYPGDQRGLIGAMVLATDVLAGKVMLAGSVALPDENDSTKAKPSGLKAIPLSTKAIADNSESDWDN